MMLNKRLTIRRFCVSIIWLTILQVMLDFCVNQINITSKIWSVKWCLWSRNDYKWLIWVVICGQSNWIVDNTCTTTFMTYQIWHRYYRKYHQQWYYETIFWSNVNWNKHVRCAWVVRMYRTIHNHCFYVRIQSTILLTRNRGDIPFYGGPRFC